jgi:tRNA A-37 threonylcarbamoyl transferase component Bud32
MKAGEYAKVKKVFARAVQVPDDARVAFVKQQCSDNEQVEREVLSLLQHHRQDTVLDTPPRTDPSRTLVVNSPSQIDPYLILSDVWEDNRQILRHRLCIIACVMAVLIILSMVRLFTYHSAEWGYGVRVAALAISLGCASVLHRRRDLTLSQIRIAELLVMGNAGLLAIVIDVRMMLAAAADGDLTIISINNWNYFAWTLIIFVYGVFMPNTWQRATAVLLPVVAVPSLVTKFTEWLDPRVSTLLEHDLFGMPIPAPFFAACIAVYAAHLIHGARMSAFQARQLAQYHLTRLIGQGGMGQVFEAEHLLLKRSCAIKLIQPERSMDDRALQRFEREVRATAKLTHPHTIEIYDYGQTKEGVFFFAMELLPGMNLRELVKGSGPLPPARAVHFLMEVCEALHEAHTEGLIHRDIKPANIFASQRGGIYDFTKLLDFGVVRETKADSQQSITSHKVAGTPDFMSPEQATRPDQIDARSDIYALGAVAYYLLTGRPPFVGDSPMQVMLAQINQVPENPSSFRSGIPSDLESVVMRCLTKNVDQRTASAIQLRDELEKCESAGAWTQQDAATWWNQHPIG